MGGRGVGGRASGSGGRLKRAKWVREGRKRTAARERERCQRNERGRRRESGPRSGRGHACPPRDSRTSRQSRGTNVSRACRALFLAASPSLGTEAGDPRLGRERPLRRGEPAPCLPRDPRAPPTRSLWRFEASWGTGMDGAGIVLPGLAAAKSQGAERRDSRGGEGPGGAQPGVAAAEAARRGR